MNPILSMLFYFFFLFRFSFQSHSISSNSFDLSIILFPIWFWCNCIFVLVSFHFDWIYSNIWFFVWYYFDVRYEDLKWCITIFVKLIYLLLCYLSFNPSISALFLSFIFHSFILISQAFQCLTFSLCSIRLVLNVSGFTRVFDVTRHCHDSTLAKCNGIYSLSVAFIVKFPLLEITLRRFSPEYPCMQKKSRTSAETVSTLLSFVGWLSSLESIHAHHNSTWQRTQD